MAAGIPFESEGRIRSAEREYRWFLDRGAPLRDEHGNIVKWYGTNTDIEDRRRVTDALRRSEADLAEAQRLTSHRKLCLERGERKNSLVGRGLSHLRI